MDTLIQDLRYALRGLRRTPLFTGVVVATLALGIGVNTAIFSVSNALLFNPIHYPQSHRLAILFGSESRKGTFREGVSAADFLEIQKRSRSFSTLVAWGRWDANLTGHDAPERVRAIQASPEFFATLRVQPALGRPFRADEGALGREQVAVLGHGLWQRRFASDPAVVGREVMLDGRPYTVVGVAPEGFLYPESPDLWTPLAFTPQQATDHGSRWLSVFGRLRDGVTVRAAAGEARVLGATFAKENPATNQGHGLRLVTFASGVLDDVSPTFYWLMLVTVAFVLLIACANVANLLLARSALRRREIALRRALGARPGRLIRQCLTESVVLAGFGGGLGVLVAQVTITLIHSAVPVAVTRFIPGWGDIGLDATALLFTAAIALVTGLLCGLSPALHLVRQDDNEALKDGGRAGGAGRAPRRLQHGLVVAQVALALVMLVGAGLLVQGFRRLAKPAYGFDPQGVLAFSVALPDAKYSDAPRIAAFYERAQERLAAVPGVQSAAFATVLPWSGGSRLWPTVIDGSTETRPAERPQSSLRVVSPGFFATLRVPLLKGREFAAQDRAGGAPVAIVSAGFARRAWGSGDPLGRRLRLEGLEGGDEWHTVVGVCGDLKRGWWDRQAMPAVYMAAAQLPRANMDVAVRTAGDAAALTAGVRQAIEEVDAAQPVYDVATMEHTLADQISGVRVGSIMMMMFAALALFLSVLGVYAVLAYAVEQRTHEIGVRVALGAQHRDILGLVIGNGMRLAGIGLAVGLPLAFLVARVMAATMFGVVRADVLVIAAYVLLLGGAALLAAWLPARRASRVDPIIALRCE